MGFRSAFGRPRLFTLSWRALLALGLVLAAELPSWAGSSLSAWRISRDGNLELRTNPGIQVQAFFEEGRDGRGPRVWVDLPGAPSRTRVVPAAGAVREVRIGKPDPGTTRLVLEFQPGTRLDPAQLRLVGTARDRWRMELDKVQRDWFKKRDWSDANFDFEKLLK